MLTILFNHYIIFVWLQTLVNIIWPDLQIQDLFQIIEAPSAPPVSYDEVEKEQERQEAIGKAVLQQIQVLKKLFFSQLLSLWGSFPSTSKRFIWIWIKKQVKMKADIDPENGFFRSLEKTRAAFAKEKNRHDLSLSFFEFQNQIIMPVKH